ncbi:hypothetical protein FA15DRAFT_224684 [Coprinopsis marcescibilis]|uniref:Uncharacterized protein n=1 Tax=Coprinopsis marcescibilis TaxID=230819 RepID=A0A5C3KGT0_COPMA|nr:hypothetical protein FA15DRAFT_224684 [Coprinopsis marcescibilis]
MRHPNPVGRRVVPDDCAYPSLLPPSTLAHTYSLSRLRETTCLQTRWTASEVWKSWLVHTHRLNHRNPSVYNRLSPHDVLNGDVSNRIGEESGEGKLSQSYDHLAFIAIRLEGFISSFLPTTIIPTTTAISRTHSTAAGLARAFCYGQRCLRDPQRCIIPRPGCLEGIIHSRTVSRHAYTGLNSIYPQQSYN